MKKLVFILIPAFVISTILLIFLAAPVSADENTLEVGEGKAYATIQAAVDAAIPGDTILVYPGFYDENVLVTTDHLEIIAQNEGVTVHSSIFAQPSFAVYADYVTIRGFHTTGFLLGCNSGIEFQGSFNTFTENLIDPGSCPGVNALMCRDPDGGSNYNRIENNTIVHGDMGIVMTSTSSNALNVGNIIRNNTINNMGSSGIVVENGLGFTISGNTIPGSGFGHCMTIVAQNNTSQGGHQIIDNQVWNCEAYGIALWADNQTTFRDNLISQNEVSFSLHGINLYADPQATLSQNLIQGNSVYHNFEVGMLLEPGAGSNTIQDNLVETNHNFGVLISSNRNKIVGNTVRDNAADGINVDGNLNKIIANTVINNDGWDLADYGLYNRWLLNEYGASSWEAEVGWVVGQGNSDGYGAIVYTTDGGENWVRQGGIGEIPDTALSGVSAIDGCNAWVVGGKSDGYGVILRTTDGGSNWIQQGGVGQIPDLDTSAVYAINNRIAWVVGADGLILRTVNGGRSWTRQGEGAANGSLLQGVYASDPWHVWVVGDKPSPCPDDICGLILYSRDGGLSWEEQKYIPSDGNLGGYLLTVHGLDSKNIWAVGNGTVVHTTDGGKNWHNVTPLNGGGFYDWNGVFAVNENAVWVARDNDGIFMYDGSKWHTYSPPPPTGSGGFHLVRVSAVDPDRVWIAGPGWLHNTGIILHTRDGGITWEEQNPGFEAGFWGVSFVKSPVCNPNP